MSGCESWRSFHQRHASKRLHQGGPTYVGEAGTEKKKFSSFVGLLSVLTGGRFASRKGAHSDLSDQPISLYDDSTGDLGYNFDE
jgi:hypothetical protein